MSLVVTINAPTTTPTLEAALLSEVDDFLKEVIGKYSGMTVTAVGTSTGSKTLSGADYAAGKQRLHV